MDKKEERLENEINSNGEEHWKFGNDILKDIESNDIKTIFYEAKEAVEKLLPMVKPFLEARLKKFQEKLEQKNIVKLEQI